MRRLIPVIAVAALALASVGCAGKTYVYAWGNYDDALYSFYKSPGERQKYVAALKAIILATERDGTKIPPGIYAEYGYALCEEGNAAEATAYYRREMQAWPASTVFMEKMIAAAQRQPKPGPPQGPPPPGPATTLEKATGS
jgi:hypothetical protein